MARQCKFGTQAILILHFRDGCGDLGKAVSGWGGFDWDKGGRNCIAVVGQ